MDDIDPPRQQPGADKLILQTLEAHGLEWDSTILFQSSRLADYQDIVDELLERGIAYYCNCSRQQLKDQLIYPGTCRERRLKPQGKTAVRIAVTAQKIQFNDAIQGAQSQQMDVEVGDFVIFRKDGLVAYQLAAAVDDAFQQISNVVRGQDLLSSTSRQCYLFETLKLNQPHYAHIPLITNSLGQKLSKQNLAQPLDISERITNLYSALIALGQKPPKDLAAADLNALLTWGITHWNIAQVPREKHIPLDHIIEQSLKNP